MKSNISKFFATFIASLFFLTLTSNVVASSKANFIVKIYKMHVVNNSEGPMGREKAEFKLTLDVNGTIKEISKGGIQDNKTYAMSEYIEINNHPINKPIKIKVVGYEADPNTGDWWDIHRKIKPNPNDYIGSISKEYPVENNNYSVFSSTGHFELSYKIIIIP